MALLQDMFASCFESTAAEKQALKFWGTLDGTVLSGHTNINRNASPLDQSRPQLVWTTGEEPAEAAWETLLAIGSEQMYNQ